MIKSRIFSLLLAGFVWLSISQRNAYSNDTVSSTASSAANSSDGSTEPINASSADSASDSKTANSSKHSGLAKDFFGVLTGVVVGTPVCMVRKPMDEDKYAVSDLTGNSKKGRAVWAPFSAVQGVLEAPFYALNNSLVNYDKPFSKEQFSLVKPGASIKKEEKLPVPAPHDVR
jgi:hypothetical protein